MSEHKLDVVRVSRESAGAESSSRGGAGAAVNANRTVEVVVALTRAGGFGKNGGMPWPTLKRDLARLCALTTTVVQPQATAITVVDPSGTAVAPPAAPATAVPMSAPTTTLVTGGLAPETKTAVASAAAAGLGPPPPKTCNVAVMGYKTFVSLRGTKFFAAKTRRCIVIRYPRPPPPPSPPASSSSSSSLPPLPPPTSVSAAPTTSSSSPSSSPPPPPPPPPTSVSAAPTTSLSSPSSSPPPPTFVSDASTVSSSSSASSSPPPLPPPTFVSAASTVSSSSSASSSPPLPRSSSPSRPPPKTVSLTATPGAQEGDRVYDVSGTPILCAPTLRDALEMAWAMTDVACVFVIGGARLYRETIGMIECTRVHHTQILRPFDCDVFIPPTLDPVQFYLADEWPVVVEADVPYQWLTYDRRHQERQYLDTVRHVIELGKHRSDRTGVGTRSLFGCVHRYSCRDGVLPLFTTKRVFWRGVVEELAWLIKGKTGAKELSAKGVKIWDDNGTKAFLESIGQGDREEGDLGPIYGHQWRFFGAPYVDCKTDHSGRGGVDQLLAVLEQIKNQPDSRRILMSAWNPMDLARMALPPCHVLVQFHVDRGELSCCMYQRSADLGLGVPFNVASYALMLHLFANHCGLRAGEFVHFMGDTHVYQDHVTELTKQVERAPRAFPKLRIRKHVADVVDGWSFDDLELVDYHPHKDPVKLKMAV